MRSTRQRAAATRLLVLAFVVGIAFLQISMCGTGTAVTACCDHGAVAAQSDPGPAPIPFVSDVPESSQDLALELCLIITAVLLLVSWLLHTPLPVGLRAPPVPVTRLRPALPSPPALAQLCVSRT